jgi:hypothetical protein
MQRLNRIVEDWHRASLIVGGQPTASSQTVPRNVRLYSLTSDYEPDCRVVSVR